MDFLKDREKAVTAIQTLDNGWQPPEEARTFGEKVWRPDLVHPTEGVLHISLGPELGSPWVARLNAARASGEKVELALMRDLLSIETLRIAQDIFATIFLMESADALPPVKHYPSPAHMIALEDLRLPEGGLRILGEALLDAALAATTADEKGKLFEQLVALILSQTSWLTVKRIRSINQTEEIDLVLTNSAVGAIGGIAAGPVVLASAKNERDPIGKKALTDLLQHMDNRRRRCRLGFLFASRDIAQTVRIERLRGSRGDDRVVVLVDGAKVEKLLQATDLDSVVEDLLIEAVMD